MLVNDNAKRFDHSLDQCVAVRDLAIRLQTAVSKYGT